MIDLITKAASIFFTLSYRVTARLRVKTVIFRESCAICELRLVTSSFVVIYDSRWKNYSRNIGFTREPIYMLHKSLIIDVYEYQYY